MPDPWYYRNPKGLVAISVDEGETVCIPSGKVLPWAEAWEETMDNLGAELTPAQQAVIDKIELEAQERANLTGIDKMVADLEDRTIAERAKHEWVEKPREHPVLPEGAQVICSDPDD